MAKAGVFFTSEEFNLYFAQLNPKKGADKKKEKVEETKLSVKQILNNFENLKKRNIKEITAGSRGTTTVKTK